MSLFDDKLVRGRYDDVIICMRSVVVMAVKQPVKKKQRG
jgi:hypothetical protein